MRTFNRLVLAVLVISLASCNNHPSSQTGTTVPRTDSTSTASSIDPGEPILDSLLSDGVSVHYTITGSGDTTLFFVHGWAIDQGYWSSQVDFFKQHYRVVTVDLPGFGSSGKNRQDWSVENYGRDLTAIIDQLDLKKIVLIGHSMSGAIVVETARLNPGRIVGLVGIDNLKGFGGGMTPAEKKQMQQAYAKARINYGWLAEEFSKQLFSKSTKKRDFDRVTNSIYQADSVIAINVLEKNDEYPISERLKALDRKLYLVNSDYTTNDTASFRKAGVPVTLFVVHATGHYPMIQQPQIFNQQLQTAIHEMSAD